MDQSIRTYIYAIVIVSFCIGLLYGMQGHAEEAAPADKMVKEPSVEEQIDGPADKTEKVASCESVVEEVTIVTSDAIIKAVGKAKAEKVRVAAVAQNHISKEQALAERNAELRTLGNARVRLGTVLTEISASCKGEQAKNLTAEVESAGKQVDAMIEALTPPAATAAE